MPRYLIQLESVGLLKEMRVAGKSVWSGEKSIFEGIQSEEEILQPIKKFLSGY